MKMLVNLRRVTVNSSNINISRSISKLEEKKLRKEKRKLERLENQRKKLEKRDAKEKVDDSYYDRTLKAGDKKNVTLGLPSKYNSQFVESTWYDWWAKEGFFTPKAEKDKNSFTICLPPPNVTGTLHLGHALGVVIEDSIIRYHRMNGKNALYIPGCDHAGIATQVIVEKYLAKQGKTRNDMEREEFIAQAQIWKNEKTAEISQQLKKLGASVDWNKFCFTMDDNMNQAVHEAFLKLFHKGLIYRANKLINHCCTLNSTISDIEIENVEIKTPTKLKIPGYDEKLEFGKIVEFSYPIFDSKNEEIVVATTRLETMLGDVAIAVNPRDNRYSSLHNKKVIHPITKRLLPIICDESVDMEFGTGAVKITPAHDFSDMAMAERHNLRKDITVIDDKGYMINCPFPFSGLPRFIARMAVKDSLKSFGYYKGEKEHSMSLPICSRSGDVIEPRVKAQWFINSKEMANRAIEVVQNGKLKFKPAYFENIWNNWLENIQDWCISRQLWWGHRIPAYNVLGVNDDSVWIAARNFEDAKRITREKFGIDDTEFSLKQDDDVLDTWFSSSLYPLSSLGWPQNTRDFRNFFPTNVLDTGSDILFFWVARMVMMSLELTNQLPFDTVLLHSVIRDGNGRKMSKSLGNVIDPMDVINGTSLESLKNRLDDSNLSTTEIKTAKECQEKDFPFGIESCGSDALRFALASYNFYEPHVNININHIVTSKRFCNKIWNTFKFIQNRPSTKQNINLKEELNIMSSTDKWILSRLYNVIKDEDFKSYELYRICDKLESFWKNDFSDIYLEYAKNELDNELITNILNVVLETLIKALHPFMPFITEELYQRMRIRGKRESICITPYPKSEDFVCLLIT
ncbi:DgyrCDS11191 [Dimorphilus gyrociliatus]|uniref:valine--tRNA ligase n=1 Tax=Dimorphilus gyrociliatus TaxID=2664684 RepID=A0A7I8W3L7_9ANNE|nr:DgyrCDS11191 [Dimorphilus gyrociliatus]